MVSAALQPNLANVSTAFILCSALYILMVLLVLFWSRISAAAPPVKRYEHLTGGEFVLVVRLYNPNTPWRA